MNEKGGRRNPEQSNDTKLRHLCISMPVSSASTEVQVCEWSVWLHTLSVDTAAGQISYSPPPQQK